MLSPASLPVANPQPNDLESKRIYLLHRFQGQRVGQRLMPAALSQARASGAGRVLLGVYAENHDALAFYARCGFAQVGRRTFRVGRTDCQDVLLGMTL
ncbi:GNAT family N-acetyltransferase [Janthinobacterium sp. LB3P112]|uniref:GNAT family N-acetyltransferase n=1 Tax=Janthinobacterium sp. LB3P112 TaxID=3424196 RepID=UPI003F244EAF